MKRDVWVIPLSGTASKWLLSFSHS